MRMISSEPLPKTSPVVKIDRHGHTWQEISRKVEEAARIATEVVKPGKPLPAPVIKKS
jgi:hypothetical protein